MDPPVTTFQDQVVRYLEHELVPDVSSDYQHYLGCDARPLNESDVQVRNLQFLRRNSHDEIELVDDHLRTDRIVFEFQFRSDVDWETWDDLLTQFTATTDCHHLAVPYSVKWENTDPLGRLKADERFDDQEYIRERIGPRSALGTAMEFLLHEYLPRELEQLTKSTDIPILIQRIYNEKAESMENLRRS